MYMVSPKATIQNNKYGEKLLKECYTRKYCPTQKRPVKDEGRNKKASASHVLESLAPRGIKLVLGCSRVPHGTKTFDSLRSKLNWKRLMSKGWRNVEPMYFVTEILHFWFEITRYNFDYYYCYYYDFHVLSFCTKFVDVIFLVFPIIMFAISNPTGERWGHTDISKKTTKYA